MLKGMHDATKKEFHDKKQLKITEIYELTANALNKENDKKFQHSIRGVIHQLKKHNFIIRVSDGEYRLNE